MSVTLAKVRGRVRARLRDGDAKEGTFSPIEVDQAIAEAYLTLQSRLPAPILYTASAFTISPNTDTFTLPVTIASSGYGTGTTEYAGDVRIQLATTGAYLVKLSQQEMDAFKHRQPATLYSVPYNFALYEDKSNVMQGRVYPGAKDTQVCNTYVTFAADDLRDYVGVGGAEGLDTATVLFSREAANALVLYVASDLLERMVPEDVAKRRLNPAVSKDWRQEAEVLLYQESARRNALEASGRTQRWVA